MVPSSCPPCQGGLESDIMAMAEEILEADHINNVDNTLMLHSLKACLFFFQFYCCHRRRRRRSSRNTPKNLCPFIMHHVLIVLRIYVYVSVSDPLSEDFALYISLGLLHHIQYT